MTTENKILDSARKIFLLYGYHGTTMHKIAEHAGVNKAIIHYYFRTKEKLYEKIISEIVPAIITTNIPAKDSFVYLWFITNELRNNRNHFISVFNKYALSKWGEKEEIIITKKLADLKQDEIMLNLKH